MRESPPALLPIDRRPFLTRRLPQVEEQETEHEDSEDSEEAINIEEYEEVSDSEEEMQDEEPAARHPMLARVGSTTQGTWRR